MKKLFFGTLLFVSAFSFSQEDLAKMEERKVKMKEMITKKLSLTTDQVKKLDEINAKFKPEEDELFKLKTQLKERHKNLMDKRKAELEKILTPEQKVKFQEMETKFAERKEHMMKKRKNFRNDTPPMPRP